MCFDVSHRFVPALCALLLSSCSIKEDRAECPCFLTLDFGGIASSHLSQMGLKYLDLFVSATGEFSDSISFALADNVQEYDLAVPKGDVRLLAVSAGGGRLSWREGFAIPVGEECPVLYSLADAFEASGAELRRTVLLHKDYCQLSVSVKRSYSSSLSRGFEVTVDGGVCGMTLLGMPMEGEFLCSASSSADGVCTLRLPRQLPSSLYGSSRGRDAPGIYLTIRYPDTDDIRSYPIGEYIAQSGYDWTAPDLEDISLEVDFSLSGVTFTISKWKKTLSFEITI